jgi:hypothetical protein
MVHLSKLKKGMKSEQIAINEKGAVEIFDVKTESYRKTWKPGTRICRKLTQEQKKLKMKFIFVDKDGACTVRLK